MAEPDVSSSVASDAQLSAFPRTIACIEQGLETRLHIGAQIHITLRDEVLLDAGFGETGRNAPMTPDSINLLLSASKPLLAVLLAQLWEEDLLQLDDPVARFIPEFAARGKEGVTLRHLLMHTGGFRGVATTWSVGSWEQLIGRICAAPLEPRWTPGLRAGYHVASSWNILAEVIQRISARPLPDFIRERLLLPVGMDDTYLTLTREQHQQLLPRLGLMHNTNLPDPAPQPFENPDTAALLRPAGNTRAPVNQLGRFYQTLLNKGLAPTGRRILRPQTVEALTSRHRTAMFDETFRQKMDWGLGFMLNSAFYSDQPLPYGFGPHASQWTFGHGGSQSSSGFADPLHQLTVAVLFNGMCGDEKHTQRIHALAGAVYEDLGLAGTPPSTS